MKLIRQTPVTLLAGLLAANVAAWLWAWHACEGHIVLLGSAFLAWTFGLRHAVDADHIAAIDNVVRKLVQDGRRPLAAGLWFSLGHATIVVLASLAVAIAARTMQHQLPQWGAFYGVIGTAVSAGFLLAMGLANLVMLRGIWRRFRLVQRGDAPRNDDADMLLTCAGPMARLFRPLFRAVRNSRHMYALGFLFGLGFDTATEIGVLGLTAVEAAHGMSPWTIMVFAAVFTAGMALIDTADSVLMTGAYGWALANPTRKLWYNLTMTMASVLVALLIGGMEVLGLIGNHFALAGRFWDTAADRNGDLKYMGVVIVGGFMVCWACSMLVYWWRGYDAPA